MLLRMVVVYARLFARRAPWLSVLLGLLCIGGVASGAAAQESAPGIAGSRASFAYSRSPDRVVVRYRETLPALADADASRSVVVYGDGRVVLHYPRVMKRAGDYNLQLSPDELTALLGRILERNFIDLDEAEARRALRPAARRAGGETPELFAVFDEPTSTIEVNLASYRPAGSRVAARRDVARELRFYAVRAHARRYPDNAALQNLAAVQRELVALLERDDLEPAP